MLPISSLKTARSLRLLVALSFSFAVFVFFRAGWSPISRLSSSKAIAFAKSAETIATGHGGPDLNSPRKNPLLEDPIGQTSSASSSYSIPEKVWHSARFENITDIQREWTSSWLKKNPSMRQELLTDLSSEAFVREHFHAIRPDIVEVYEAIPIPILRADLLRYLIILAEGGVWSDLDVTCEKPVSKWIPSEIHGVDMVVGLEFDFEWRGPGTQVASQFCNWVFMAKPSSRNLRVVVDAVVEKLRDVARVNGVPLQNITLDMLPVDVVDVTGPKIMTISILDGLKQLLGRPVDDRDFSGIKRPKLIGDVLIMPGNSFAASQNGYPTDQGEVLVTHHYEGSWKQADAEAKERKKHKDKGRIEP